MCFKCGINPLDTVELDADCRRTFWVEAPLCLLVNFTLIPREDMTLEEKMNTITRIVLVVWILLLIFGNRRANLFLIIALVVIVLLYYARRRRLQQEGIQKLLQALGVGDLHSQHHRQAEEHRRHESKETPRHRQRIQSNSRDSDSSDSDDESSDSSSSSSSSQSRDRDRRRQAHQPRMEEAPVRNDGFERFEAKAGNGRYTAQTTQDQRPMLPSKNEQQNQPQYETVNDADAVPTDLPEEEEIDVDQELVAAPMTRKSTAGIKRNPRKPYPLTVSPSMEVRASRQENLMKSYRGGPAPKAASKFHGYQTKNFEDDERPAVHYTNRRLRGTAVQSQSVAPVQAPRSRPSQPSQVDPRMDERYEVMAENDDAEDENQEIEEIQDGEEPEEEEPEPEVLAPPVSRCPVQAPRRRVFLPANYDGFTAPPTPIVNNDRPKLTRHGAMKGRRVPTKYADSNKVEGKYNASDLEFGRAAKLEKATNSRLKADRHSQINGMFGN